MRLREYPGLYPQAHRVGLQALGSSSRGIGVFHEFPLGDFVPGVADPKLLWIESSYKQVGGQDFVSACTQEPSLVITL